MRARSRAFIFVTTAVSALLTGSYIALFSNSPAMAEDPQPSAVETYDYPDAEAIFQQRGIRLKKGDGHILFAACQANTNQIRVESTAFPAPSNSFCFNVIGVRGRLTMEIPEAFLVHGNDYNAVASWQTETGEVRNTTLRKNAPTPIGEGVTGAPGVLIELNTAK